MKKFLSLFLTLAVTLSSASMVACSKLPPFNYQYGDATFDISATASLVDLPDVTSSLGGSVSVSSNAIEYGKDLTINIAPNTGYALEDLLINGVSVIETDASFDFSSNSYIIKNVLRDYTIKAVFAKKNVLVVFNGELAQDLPSQTALYKKTLGQAQVELPQLFKPGYKFNGWLDAESQNPVDENTIVTTQGTLELISSFSPLTEEDKQGLTPFGSTVVYHDATAMKYGVTWHTSSKPIQPVMQVVEGSEANFANARVIDAEWFGWYPIDEVNGIYADHVISGVVDGLEYETQYTVRFGDLAADVWGDAKTFTTKEENPDSANFFYVLDTQERNHSGDNASQLEEGAFWKQVMREATASHDADFVIHGGDLLDRGAYPFNYLDDMLSSMDNWLFELPVMPVSGNHEDIFKGENCSYWPIISSLYNIDSVQLGENEEENYSMESRGPVYSFDYGPAHFVMLRSNDIFVKQDWEKNMLHKEQMDWIIKDVTTAKQKGAKWIIATMHEGPVRANTVNGNYVKQIIPAFNEIGVDLVLYAHDHALMATYPIGWDEAKASEVNDNYYGSYTTATLGTPDTTTRPGSELATFDYADPAKRGVVFYQVATSGNQMSNSNLYNDNLAKWYRRPIEGGMSHYPNLKSSDCRGHEEGYSMYSYIEVTATDLIVRTYGVQAKKVYKQADGTDFSPYTKYYDGFILSK